MIEGAVRLMRFYERRSRAGKPYFVGFLGQSRVLIMRDDRAELNGDTVGVWDVFVKERDEQSDQQPQPGRAASYDHDGPVDTRPGYSRRSQPARPKARPAQPSTNTAKNKAAREINERLAHVSLNDDISDL